MKRNNKTLKIKKKPNIDHFVHQVNVTGTGQHKNKSKEIPRKKKYKEEGD